MFRENDEFDTSVFRKDAFSRLCTNFISFVKLEHKFGLVHNLLNHCFFFSDFLKFNHKVRKGKKILLKNLYL